MTDKYWTVENSNLFMLNTQGKVVLNTSNLFGLIVRTIFNIGFQLSIMMGFAYARKASLNAGIVTSLLSTYCVLVSIMAIFVFKENLKTKFIIGMFFILVCVGLVSNPSG